MTEQNNTKYIDLLDEDKPIAGQKFVCVSFVSPDKILKQKEMFMFEKFLKYFDFDKSISKFQQFLNFMCYKYGNDQAKVMADFENFISEEKENLIQTTIEDEYKSFVDKQGDDVDKEFSEMHHFQTNTRGLKIRGAFETQAEAELRCKMLREVDPNHDIFVGPVGMWMPWHPEAYKTGKVDYLEKELNELMSHKDENEQHAKREFDTRVKESRQIAMKDNIQKAKESGNKLTQRLDENGDLVKTDVVRTIENTLLTSDEPVTSADIKRELFEGEGILTSKDKRKD